MAGTLAMDTDGFMIFPLTSARSGSFATIRKLCRPSRRACYVSGTPEIGLDQRTQLRRYLGPLAKPQLKPAHRLMQEHAQPVSRL